MNFSLITKEMFGNSQMNIYQNENKDVFMTREQIGHALEYKSPRKAIKDIHLRNKGRFDNFSRGAQIETPSGKQETIIYNEQGIYEIIRRSAQPKADEFYDWVYDVLSKLRKGDLQVNKPNNTKLLLKTALEHEEKIESIQSDVNHLKETMRIDGVQEFQIRKLANIKVVKALGGKKAPAYKTLSNKAFSRFWRDFKEHFTIPRYGDLPKVKYDEAIEFIHAWQPDTSTRLDIQSANRQQSPEARGVI